MLEKKEKVLVKKAAAEVEKAKEFSKGRNKRGMDAILLLNIFHSFPWFSMLKNTNQFLVGLLDFEFINYCGSPVYLVVHK